MASVSQDANDAGKQSALPTNSTMTFWFHQAEIHATGEPQFRQNFAPVWAGVPHFGHAPCCRTFSLITAAISWKRCLEYAFIPEPAWPMNRLDAPQEHPIAQATPQETLQRRLQAVSGRNARKSARGCGCAFRWISLCATRIVRRNWLAPSGESLVACI